MQQGGLFSAFANKIPTLTTSRLTLRALQVRDSADMYEYASLDTVTKYLLWESHRSEKQTRQYLEYVQKLYRAGELYDWAIVFNGCDKMIGTCGFASLDTENRSGEAGYVLHPHFWGMEIAKEALLRVMQFGFTELGLHRIVCRHMLGNAQSARVMEKCGMQYEGTNRESIYVKGAYRTVAVYAMVQEDFTNRNQIGTHA